MNSKVFNKMKASVICIIAVLAITACTGEPAKVENTDVTESAASTASISEAVVTDAPETTPEATTTEAVKINKTNEQLYNEAVIDSMTIEDDEIYPLVEISADSELCTFNDDGMVLMLAYHSYPDSYVAGEEYILKYGAVWTFTDKEMVKWYKESKDGVTDWELRFKQLIGLPEGRTYTHFSAMWVNPDDILRPAYAWKLSDTSSLAAFAEGEPSEEFKVWFDDNIVWSYFESAYPWTRLGYTYDWADDCDDYGLSEFLVAKDSVTQVEFTLTTEEFINWLETQ